MEWIHLAIAIVFELVFALSINATKGFTKLWPSVVTVLAGAGATFFLSLALRTIDVSVGYTIWTGIGSVGTVLLGALLFKEKITGHRMLCFAAIIVGVIGLRFASGA